MQQTWWKLRANLWYGTERLFLGIPKWSTSSGLLIVWCLLLLLLCFYQYAIVWRRDVHSQLKVSSHLFGISETHKGGVQTYYPSQTRLKFVAWPHNKSPSLHLDSKIIWTFSIPLLPPNLSPQRNVSRCVTTLLTVDSTHLADILLLCRLVYKTVFNRTAYSADDMPIRSDADLRSALGWCPYQCAIRSG